MANRRSLFALARHSSSLLPSNAALNSKTLPLLSLFTSHSLVPESHPSPHFPPEFPSHSQQRSHLLRYFSSTTTNPSKESDIDDEGEHEEEEEEEDVDEEESGGVSASNYLVERTKSTAEKEKEAAAIGYEVIGPLNPSDRPFKKQWELVFAVVQVFLLIPLFSHENPKFFA